MKTKNRVLLTSAALLALSAVTLGSSTYAWFTGSNSNTTTISNVNAVLPANLTETHDEKELKTLTDVSSVDGQNFFKGVLNSTQKGFTSVYAINKEDGFYWTNTFNFKYDGVNTNIYGAPTLQLSNVSITSSHDDANVDLANAVRVAFIVNDVTKYVYGNVANDKYGVVAEIDASTENNDTSAKLNAAFKPTTTVEGAVGEVSNYKQPEAYAVGKYLDLDKMNLTQTTATLSVKVVIWVEGTAAACNNAGKTALDSVNVSFSVYAQDNAKA